MRREQRRQRVTRAVAAALGALLLALPALAWPSPAQAQTASPPPQPASGQLGSPGPCTVPATPLVRDNAWDPDDRQRIWVYQPTGTGAPRTGGTCGDSQRPVVLVIHGFPVVEFIGVEMAVPDAYLSLIQNLVSNGYLVVFANYDSNLTTLDGLWIPVWVGFLQAVKGISDGSGGLPDQLPMTTRANLRRVGMWGHSFGGGMIPQLALLTTTETTTDGPDPGTAPDAWGQEALWTVFNGASDGMYHCNIDDDNGDGNPYGAGENDVLAPWPLERPTPDKCNPTQHSVNMPPNARVLFVTYDREWSGVYWASERLYLDMTPVASKWGIIVRSDCSHDGTPDASRYPCPSPTHPTSHLTPVDPLAPGDPPIDHLKWYGSNRNTQALAECAIPGDQPPAGNDCNIGLLHPMGTWTDGVAATPSVTYVPPP
jgi:hypothetical protein